MTKEKLIEQLQWIAGHVEGSRSLAAQILMERLEQHARVIAEMLEAEEASFHKVEFTVTAKEIK